MLIELTIYEHGLRLQLVVINEQSRVSELTWMCLVAECLKTLEREDVIRLQKPLSNQRARLKIGFWLVV